MSTKRQWLDSTYKKGQERPVRFSTVSDLEIEPLYTPEDLKGDYETSSAIRASFRTRAASMSSMYRGRLWTMRQFAGFGLAEDTNTRFHFLLAQGQDGLSTAFDMPTLMGYDADHERARGEVGREGVSVILDRRHGALFDRIPLDKVSTSMTVNCSASVLLAMYLVIAERQGVPWNRSAARSRTTCSRSTSRRRNGSSPPRPSCASSPT